MLVNSQDFFNEWWPQLLPLYDEREARALMRWLLEDYFDLSQVDILSHRRFSVGDTGRLTKAVERLLSGEPVQHVLGYAWFCGRRYEVSPEVLIPRPETEELVQVILDENPGFGGKVLDIGTGSGIIAIALKIERPEADIYGLDISAPALAVAKRNAAAHGVSINWTVLDVLSACPAGSYDLIVSNPPYIPVSDSSEMHPNVVGRDPDVALFVSDEDPLVYYRRIAELSGELLRPCGKLYFEIHERMGSAIRELLGRYAFDEVRILQDLNGKDRMISAYRREGVSGESDQVHQ